MNIREVSLFDKKVYDGDNSVLYSYPLGLYLWKCKREHRKYYSMEVLWKKKM